MSHTTFTLKVRKKQTPPHISTTISHCVSRSDKGKCDFGKRKYNVPRMLRRNLTRFLAAAASAQHREATETEPLAGGVSSSSSSSSSKSALEPFHPFEYKVRIRYSKPFLTKITTDFFLVQGDHAHVLASTYLHSASGVTVTLIPVVHHAHPKFFQQVDSLCCQHESVLMEGRVPITGAPYSTLVPPRDFKPYVKPEVAEDSEGWEPTNPELFWQPFSWGVKGSPLFTVVHAADKYDYEKLPWWASLRFNMPFVGNFAREKHCLDMIPGLTQNGYKSFAVPWGADHIPIFHDMLVDHGFEQIGSCSLILWSRIDGDHSAMWFRKIQHEIQQSKLWGKWTSRLIIIGFAVYFGPKFVYFDVDSDRGGF